MVRFFLTSMALICLSRSLFAVPVTDSLIMHFKADDLALNEGDTVSIWPDRAISDSVDGTLKPASGANQPTFTKTGYNGLPAVRFQSANGQALICDTYTWPNVSNGLTVFMVCTGHNSRAAHIGSPSGTAGKTFDIDAAPDITAGSGVRFNNGYTLTDNYINPNPVYDGQWHISVRQMSQGGSYKSLIYAVNDFPALTMYSNNPNNTLNFDASNNVLIAGNSKQNGNWMNAYYNGYISELLVYNKRLSTSEMQQMLSYLRDQYNTAAHNPTPAYDSCNQGTLTSNKRSLTFRWYTGLNDDLATVNSGITQHYFYLSEDPAFTGVSPVAINADSSMGTYGPILLDQSKTYYWRVDEGISSLPNDPETIRGPVWYFSTNEYPDANPVMQAADPDVLLIGNTVYIYPTSGPARQFFTYSSTDLVNWQTHGPILDFNNVSWIPSTGRNAWAPGIIEKNGTYYLYYSVGPKPSDIGVAWSSSLTGPFIDSGQPLLSDYGMSGFEAIDAMAFKDPVSGKYYLYAGGSAGSTLRVFELNSDMLSFKEEIVIDNPINFTEGAFMHYRNGIYYMSYSHGSWKMDTYSVHYSTSSTPIGPWTYRGAILESNETYKGPGHHSFLYNGATDEWYIFYHRWENVTGSGPYNTNGASRSTAIERLNYEANGLIKPVVMTSRGIGPIPVGKWLASDFNEDGSVGLPDLNDFCNAWLTADVMTDIVPVNGDGFVDLQDFELFSSQWGR